MKYAKHDVDGEVRICRIKRRGRKNTRLIWLQTGDDYLVPTSDYEVISASEAGVDETPAASETLPPLPPQNLSGEELSQMMTANRVTVKTLAERLGISMEEVRQARKNGIDGLLIVHEWTQALNDHLEVCESSNA